MTDVEDFDACDEHETTFLRGDYCPYCRIKLLSEQITLLNNYIEELDEEKPDAAEIIELRKAVNIYATTGKGYREKIEFLTHRVEELEIEIKEWETGALVRGWKEKRKPND